MSESLIEKFATYFGGFRNEFIRLHRVVELDVALPDITCREGSGNETNENVVVLALPPQDTDPVRMARHLFGHWMINLADNRDSDEVADAIGQAVGRWETPVAVPDLDSRTFLQALVSHAEAKRQATPNPRWKRAYEAIEMSASTLDAFIARATLPMSTLEEKKG